MKKLLSKELLNLTYPAVYKHFKNKYYATMGCSLGATKKFIAGLLKEGQVEFIGYFRLVGQELSDGTEPDNAFIPFYRDKEGLYIHLVDDVWGSITPGTLVIYKSLYDLSPVYGREVTQFFSKVDRDKYTREEYPQEYRFQRMRG